MRFGALLVPNVPWAEVAKRAAGAEAAGFDAVFVDDHVAHPGRPEGPWLDAWTTLAALATTTRRVTLGPLVANVVLRRPAVLARHAASVDEISGGRLDLGIGAGYAATDHAAVGEAPWPPRERLRRFAAAVDELRPRVKRLTVAAHEPGALRVAAAHADTWVSYGGFGLAPDEAFALTRARSDRLSELTTRPIRRRLLAGSAALTQEPIWQSVGAFDDFVGRYGELGIDELALHWPPHATNPNVDQSVVDEIVSRF